MIPSEPPPQPDHLDRVLDGLSDAPQWIVGFSGGVDSTVLLHLLNRWCGTHPDAPQLTAVHVNHGLQGAADDWQNHCEWICTMLRIPFASHRVTVSGASEAAAREARYQVFEESVGDGGVLFLGHHLDDQVETFFLRLMRGAGVQGLAAIPSRRALGAGSLARPLLQFTREQLEAYALAHGLQHIDDPSNSDTAMDRNFLRAELLPLLASRWPAYRRTVARASAHMAGTISALEQVLPAPTTVHSVMGDPGLLLEELLAHSEEAAAIRLRNWLRARSRLAPDQSHLEEFLRQLLESESGASPELAYGDTVMRRYRDSLYLLPLAFEAHCAQPFQLSPGETYLVPGVGEFGLQIAAEDGLSLQTGERLRVAWRQGGERCRPRERAGSNSLKKLLQEYGVPPWWRDRVPLLYLGDELLAVGDLWLCASTRWRDSAQGRDTLWRPCWKRHPDTADD